MVSWRRSGGNLLREDSSITELGAGAAAKTDRVHVHRVRSSLSIIGDIDYNRMRHCDSHGMHTVSLLTYHGELAEAHGKMNSMKSLCTGSVLKCGV